MSLKKECIDTILCIEDNGIKSPQMNASKFNRDHFIRIRRDVDVS